MSLNAIRSYISYNAFSKGIAYGTLYGGVAIFSSLGALVFGYIWQHFGVNSTLMFSVIGMIIMFTIFLFWQYKFFKPNF